jgi:hypothetical protein
LILGSKRNFDWLPFIPRWSPSLVLQCENAALTHSRRFSEKKAQKSVTVVFLKKSNISGIFPSTIRAVPWVGEEEVALTVLSNPKSFPVLSSSTSGLTGRGLVTVSLAIECGAIMAQWAAVQKLKMGM